MFYRLIITLAIIIYSSTVPAFADDYFSAVTEVFALKKISVGGNKLFPDREIRNSLGLEKGKTYERYLFDYLLEQGILAIKERYVNEGYLDARISWSFRDVKEDSRKLEIRVEEGDRA